MLPASVNPCSCSISHLDSIKTQCDKLLKGMGKKEDVELSFMCVDNHYPLLYTGLQGERGFVAVLVVVVERTIYVSVACPKALYLVCGQITYF